MYSNWRFYLVCPCGAGCPACNASHFWTPIDCCLKCGEKKPAVLKNGWKVVRRRWFYGLSGRLFCPWTWHIGHWEELP